MPFTDFLKQNALEHALKNATYTPTANTYVALYTVAPTVSGGGTEVTGGSYARLAVSWTAYASATGGFKNSADLNFAAATAGWGTVVAVGLVNASTGGNILAWASVTSKVVNSGDVYQIKANDMTVSIT